MVKHFCCAEYPVCVELFPGIDPREKIGKLKINIFVPKVSQFTSALKNLKWTLKWEFGHCLPLRNLTILCNVMRWNGEEKKTKEYRYPIEFRQLFCSWLVVLSNNFPIIILSNPVYHRKPDGWKNKVKERNIEGDN